MGAEIIDRGRGPQIAGTRITVYDIMDYYTEGWHPSSIAIALRLSSEEVEAAIAYIQEHKEEVSAVYERILERSRQGNPPEIQAKLNASRAKVQAMLKEIQEKKRKGEHAGDAGGS